MANAKLVREIIMHYSLLNFFSLTDSKSTFLPTVEKTLFSRARHPVGRPFRLSYTVSCMETESSCWVVWPSQSPDPKLVVTLPLYPEAHQQYQNIPATEQNAPGIHCCLFACWRGDELVSICMGWNAFIHNCEAVTAPGSNSFQS